MGDELKVKQERQESWEPSDESCNIRNVSHDDKQKQEAKDKTWGSLSSSKRSASKTKSFSTWESAAETLAWSRLRTAPDSKERRSYDEVKSRDGERPSRSDYAGERKIWEKRGRAEGKWEDVERGHKWLRWNFDPRRNPGPDPNWPSQLQVKVGPLPGHVTRDQLETAVREVGDLNRLFLQHYHTDFQPTETRYAYVVFREAAAALRLLKAACIHVADDYFKAGPMEERS